uniref:Uncharacterized protein n=1 Tax=Anguilla anguilla TaxID=7936 RepID=A0A0E9UHT1_ANGAN
MCQVIVYIEAGFDLLCLEDLALASHEDSQHLPSLINLRNNITAATTDKIIIK